MRLSQLSHVDLCAGAGGLALGCALAGFETIALYEKDSRSCATLLHNVAQGLLSGTVVEADISRIRWQEPVGSLALLSAGLPCQPFSVAGSHRALTDQRNLFPQLFRAIRHLRPLVVLIENVPGLIRPRFRQYFEYILAQLADPFVPQEEGEAWEAHHRRLSWHHGSRRAASQYEVRWKILNAADYGVPQTRRRLFIVASATELGAFAFPQPSHARRVTGKADSQDFGPQDAFQSGLRQHSAEGTPRDWVTVREALSGLPQPEADEHPSIRHHYLIQGARSYPRHRPSVLDAPAKTVKAGVHGIAGGENTIATNDGALRYFSLRELARLQSFPDSYAFVGPRSSIVRQIGNAVCCTLAERIATEAADMVRKFYLTRERRAI